MARKGRAPLPYCSVCHHGYRGSYAVHASTEGHRAKAYRRSIASVRVSGGSSASRRQRSKVNMKRLLAGDQGADKVKVRKHRRRRPLDGPARSVDVRRYWRDRPDVFSAAAYARQFVFPKGPKVAARKVVPW